MRPGEDEVLDLRGEICPYTFVKTKLRLNEVAPGTVLRVIVDYPPAVNNVVRNIELEGHEVTHYTRATENDWYLWVKRAPVPGARN